ncbi:class I SAM-dependent methyltransferase [Candidatus Bathyarchaeota archaeon]|nr:class I SAM-dependent methyltransferase [Candidatus Bathyarchaeota archaeon]
MLRIADVKPGEAVYDLGCGDGRIAITAALEFGARGVGVDINQNLVREARKRVEELHLGDRVKIIHGNLLEIDLSQADVVTMYLTTSANEKVRPKLEQELKPGARVVTHDFMIPKWEVTNSMKVQGEYRTHLIYLYIWQPKEGARHPAKR